MAKSKTNETRDFSQRRWMKPSVRAKGYGKLRFHYYKGRGQRDTELSGAGCHEGGSRAGSSRPRLHRPYRACHEIYSGRASQQQEKGIDGWIKPLPSQRYTLSASAV